MLLTQCNIDKTDRTNRVIFGIILVIGALLAMSKFFFIIMGIILIIEGIIGWCAIPYLFTQFKLR